MSEVALVVMAKAPVAGRSKTRLCPPCTPNQAAELASAALEDTLAAVAATPARRRLLALDGQLHRPLPGRFETLAQCEGDLGERLGHALVAAGGPALVVGMDTPQLDPELLARSAALLDRPGPEAVIGPAPDGGYWAIGLRDPDPAVFAGVPMSSPTTLTVQLRRLAELNLGVARLPELRDVDTIEDARAVAATWPRTRFALALRRLARPPARPREESVRSLRR